MRENWIKLISGLDNVDTLQCPNCYEKDIDYLYIGDEYTRIGYLQIWCNNCKKAIHISRVKIPQGVKFVSLEDRENIELPSCDFI